MVFKRFDRMMGRFELTSIESPFRQTSASLSGRTFFVFMEGFQ